jgi:valyl-tRNA synthetase
LVRKYSFPLIDREIPVIADDYVDPTFGTGIVKVTPAHDFNDYAVGARHDLPIINILTLDGHINKNGTDLYEGLDRFAARKKIIEDLKEKKYLDKIKKHKLKVPRGDRTNSIIEPMLTDQWYVSMTKSNGPNGKSIAQEALDLVSKETLSFIRIIG